MKTKVSKINILFIAIMLLLVFVAGFTLFGKTHSWLRITEDITFTVDVNQINISVRQGSRIIPNDGTGLIELGTNVIEADVKCDFTDVEIVNNEKAKGYYIRCQVFAIIGDDIYNINNCIENDFYKSSDGWMYYTTLDTQNKPTTTARQMDKKNDNDATQGVVTLMKSLTMPNELASGVYLNDIQGQVFTLHLYIEGSAVQYTVAA